ncbi:hypothetical protein ACSQ67_022659 [Phaseolus vulgaris]
MIYILLAEASFKLKLGTGILIAVPIPQEHSTSGQIIESAIHKAIEEARENNITGSAETPFLLARVNDLTGGASLAAMELNNNLDIALVKNNALVGAQVAVALAQIRKNCESISDGSGVDRTCFRCCVQQVGHDSPPENNVTYPLDTETHTTYLVCSMSWCSIFLLHECSPTNTVELAIVSH